MIELAALSAASMASTASMEAAFDKPKEWATIDLVEQRKRFGENISSLGKTSISRVWAAGKFFGFSAMCAEVNCTVMYCTVLYCNFCADGKLFCCRHCVVNKMLLYYCVPSHNLHVEW